MKNRRMQTGLRRPQVMHRDKAPKIVRLWITWWTMWITCRKKCGQSRCIPCIKATGSHFVHPLARRAAGFLFLFFFRSLFCPEKEKRTRKESREPAWVGPLRPPVSETYLPRKKYFAGHFFEKPRREKWVTDEGGGLPDCFRANPTPLRFLFFGSFFSFPERKERTIPPTAAHTPRGGPSAGLRANPTPIRFLFFGSFFSFPERKERTGKKKQKRTNERGVRGRRKKCRKIRCDFAAFAVKW